VLTDKCILLLYVFFIKTRKSRAHFGNGKAVERRNSSSNSVRGIAEPVTRKPAPPTIEECKAAVVAGNPPPAPLVPGKPKAPEGTPVITPLVCIGVYECTEVMYDGVGDVLLLSLSRLLFC
jgi:hypothetical protein